MSPSQPESSQESGGASASNEHLVRGMYSKLRYPRLDPDSKSTYVAHRRYVYSRMGLDPDSFFRGKVILDAGCGTGEETLFLSTLGPDLVIGIDTSEGSLEYAMESAKAEGISNVEFRSLSVLDESIFDDGKFDYVSSLGCIHHTPSTRGAFDNLCRLVKPGGYLATFIYNSFGHMFYNLECKILDWSVGNDVEARVELARKLFDWKRDKTFRREGVATSYDARIYDKYGVIYRDSITLKTLLGWYADCGFSHHGSFPMYWRDMINAFKAREGTQQTAEGAKAAIAKFFELLPGGDQPRHWSTFRRFSMQALLLLVGLYDYGSSFRIVGQKQLSS